MHDQEIVWAIVQPGPAQRQGNVGGPPPNPGPAARRTATRDAVLRIEPPERVGALEEYDKKRPMLCQARGLLAIMPGEGLFDEHGAIEEKDNNRRIGAR